MKRSVFCLVFFIVVPLVSDAQQLPLYSQYIVNKFLINPACAGGDGLTTVNLSAREQWVGYSGAPRTYSVSYQSRILKKESRLKKNIFNKTVYRSEISGRTGLGGFIFADRNGRIKRTGFQTAYSFHSWIDDFTQLSFGMAFTGYHFIIDSRNMGFEDPDDPWLSEALRRGMFIPDVDFGVYLTDPEFNLGFSARQLFGASVRAGSKSYGNYNMYRHYCLFGAYKLDSGDKTILQPSALVQVSGQNRPQFDVGLSWIYNKHLQAGLDYRSGGSLIASLGMTAFSDPARKSSLFIAYSFDFTLNRIQAATWGTHEFSLSLFFGDDRRKFRWKDRF